MQLPTRPTTPLASLPSAVILDMDGLLLDSERVSYACYRHTLKKFGLAGGEGVASAEKAKAAVAAAAGYGRLIGLGGERQREVLAEILPSGKGGVAVAAFDAEWRATFRQHLAQHSVPAKPGAAALCGWLAGRGVPLAVATSTQTDTARRLLARVGLLAWMRAVVGGDQVAEGRGKPAPDVYLAASDRLGVAAEACLAFEDSPPGVAAAHSAGMRVVCVPDVVAADEATRQRAMLVAESLGAAAKELGWGI